MAESQQTEQAGGASRTCQITGLPVVDRPDRRDGPWRWKAGPGLDITVEAVQRYAYDMLCQGMTWKVAMFGGDPKAVEAVEGKVSLGGDGRLFASTIDVRDAAESFQRANGLPHHRDVAKARRARKVVEAVEAAPAAPTVEAVEAPTGMTVRPSGLIIPRG